MGILEYLLGQKDSDPDDVQPASSRAGAGPDVDRDRIKTKQRETFVVSKARTIQNLPASRGVASDDFPNHA